jgi:hypothetical protein
LIALQELALSLRDSEDLCGIPFPTLKRGATAVSQLPCTGARIAERLFHQEKATLEDAGKGT